MSKKKDKTPVADDTSAVKEAASRNYGKTSGDAPEKAKKDLGKT